MFVLTVNIKLIRKDTIFNQQRLKAWENSQICHELYKLKDKQNDSNFNTKFARSCFHEKLARCLISVFVNLEFVMYSCFYTSGLAAA